MNKKSIAIPCLGYSLAADWYENNNSQTILLVLVGYGSSKDRNSDFVGGIAAKTGMNALVLDYSGHGKSPFVLEEMYPAQHLLETVTTFDWLRATYPSYTVSAMGTSYGGFMAAYLTRFRSLEKLILRTPAIYKPEDLYSLHASIDKMAVRTYRKDSAAVARHPLFLQESLSKVPTLVVVHGEDESVPTQTTDAYKAAFSAETYVADGFKHAMRDSVNPQTGFAAYQEAIVSWLKRQELV